MSNELLNDNERYVATVFKFPSTNFGQNIDYKSKIQQSYLNMPRDGPKALGMSYNYPDEDSN